MKTKKTLLFPASLFGVLLIAGLAGCGSGDGKAPSTGPRTIDSGGGPRTYYLKMPADYRSGKHYPLIIAFHGTGGSGDAFVGDAYYNLEGAVGDEAILVYPDALAPDGGTTTQWDFNEDVGFFDDLLAELDGLVHYDKDRVFLTGHSSGGGFVHQLACKRGDVVRAIAPVAGTLLTQGTENGGCTGEVAVMQIQGTKDQIVPIAAAESARNFWRCYNGCAEASAAAADDHCVQYQGCDADYPVEYCTHEEVASGIVGGHTWPSFGGEAMWAFFKSLPAAKPSADLPAEKRSCTTAGAATATFTLVYPEDFKGDPEILAIALYPGGTTAPTGAPTYMIKQRYDIDASKISPGAEVEYAIDGIDFTGVELPGDYLFSVVVYMKGGMYPIPSPRVDYVGVAPIHFENAGSFTIDDPITLSIMPDFAL